MGTRSETLRIRLQVDEAGNVTASLAGVSRGIRSASDAADAAVGGFSRLQASVVTANQALQLLSRGGAVVRELVSMADSATLLAARVKLVTSSQAEAADVQQRLFELSQRTGADLETTIQLYTRMARSTTDLKLSQGDLLRVTETINKALVISGTTSAEASGALLQLSQGFGSGVLRGQELNSVLEQTPEIARIIAREFGVSVGQLKALGEQGAITAERVIKALLGASSAVDQEFGKIPETVGRAFVTLSNEALRAVGDIDKATGATRLLVEGIHDLSAGITGFVAAGKDFGRTVSDNFNLIDAAVRVATFSVVAFYGRVLAVGAVTLAVNGLNFAFVALEATISLLLGNPLAFVFAGYAAAAIAAAGAIVYLGGRLLDIQAQTQKLDDNFGDLAIATAYLKARGEELTSQQRAAILSGENWKRVVTEQAGAARGAAGATNALAQVQGQLATKFADIDKKSQGLGKTYDANKEKAAALTAAINTLIERGINPADPAVQKLRAQLEQYAASTIPKANKAVKDLAREHKVALAEINREYEKAIAEVQKYVDAQDKALSAVDEFTAGLNREAADLLPVQERVADLTEKIHALEDAGVSAGVVAQKTADGISAIGAASETAAKQAGHSSTIVADAFEDMIAGIASGTQDLSFEGVTDALKAALAGSIKEKLHFDQLFKGNIFDLVGQVGDFILGGDGLVGNFAKAFDTILGDAGGLASGLAKVLGLGGKGSVGTGGGLDLSNIIGGLAGAAGAAGGAYLGSRAGGKSKAGQAVGGIVGGIIGQQILSNAFSLALTQKLTPATSKLITLLAPKLAAQFSNVIAGTSQAAVASGVASEVGAGSTIGMTLADGTVIPAANAAAQGSGYLSQIAPAIQAVSPYLYALAAAIQGATTAYGDFNVIKRGGSYGDVQSRLFQNHLKQLNPGPSQVLDGDYARGAVNSIFGTLGGHGFGDFLPQMGMPSAGQQSRRTIGNIFKGSNSFGDLPALTKSAERLVGEFKKGNSIFERTNDLIGQYPQLSKDALDAGSAFAIGLASKLKTPLGSNFLEASASYSDLIARMGEGGVTGKEAINLMQSAVVEFGITSADQLGTISDLLMKGKLDADAFTNALKGTSIIGVPQGATPDQTKQNQADLKNQQIQVTQGLYAQGKLTFDEYIKALNEIETTAVNTFDAVGKAFDANLADISAKSGLAGDTVQNVFTVLHDAGINSMGDLFSKSSSELEALKNKLGGTGSEGVRIFEAFSAAGITSMEELAAASGEQIKAIIEFLNGIPKEIHTTHTITTNYEGDPTPPGGGPYKNPGPDLVKNEHGDGYVPKEHATGLAYVPFDNYLARLHQGERVLTRAENENYRGFGRGVDSVGDDPEIKELLRELVAASRRGPQIQVVPVHDYGSLQRTLADMERRGVR